MLKNRLVSLRKDKGLNQYEAAKLLGFSRGKLANYEQGSRQPDYDTLEIIADFYKTSTDFLLGRTDKQNLKTDDEVERILKDPQTNLMFNDWQGMDEEQRQEALRMIKFILYKEEKRD